MAPSYFIVFGESRFGGDFSQSGREFLLVLDARGADVEEVNFYLRRLRGWRLSGRLLCSEYGRSEGCRQAEDQNFWGHGEIVTGEVRGFEVRLRR
jgi:hypothetical protein